MKHHVRTFACGAALLAVMAFVACGGRETMASKSAAAYDEAKKKGVPIASGEHGEHTAESPAQATATDTDPAAMAGMDHSQMSAAEQSQMSGMDHSKMPGMQHGTPGTPAHEMAAMDHSRMPGMQIEKHGASMQGMAGMDHSSMSGMDDSQMPGMQHGQSAAKGHGKMPGMQQGAATATAAAMPAPPTSNAAIAQTQPAATLRADEFDAPSPLAVDEAAKATTEMTHSMEAAPKAQQPAHPPKPPSEHQHDHGNGEAS